MVLSNSSSVPLLPASWDKYCPLIIVVVPWERASKLQLPSDSVLLSLSMQLHWTHCNIFKGLPYQPSCKGRQKQGWIRICKYAYLQISPPHQHSRATSSIPCKLNLAPLVQHRLLLPFGKLSNTITLSATYTPFFPSAILLIAYFLNLHLTCLSGTC